MSGTLWSSWEGLVEGLTLDDQMSRLKKLSKEERSMTAITTICPSVTSMVPKVRVPET